VKVALISPVSLQAFADSSPVHLVLPHLFANEMYRSRYSRKHHNEYWILDNGVAEDIHVDGEMLAGLANVCYADELVLPDVMGDCDATIEASREFVRNVLGRFSFMKTPVLAGVVQGKNFSEWMKCVNAYFFLPEFKSTVKTLMFPRCMNTTESGPHTRFHFLQAMFNSKWWTDLAALKTVQVHCLGASSWVREVVALSDLPIRSMDTSLPIVLGLDGIDIRTGLYAKRQSDFFDVRSIPANLWTVINDNCRTYLDWANHDRDTSPVGEVL
jgi:hypothetical protein